MSYQIVFSDVSVIRTAPCGLIRVRRHRREHTGPTCIRYYHTGAPTGVIIWETIEYSGKEAVPYLRGLEDVIFQQDNARLKLLVVSWHTLTQRVFDCCPKQHVLQISQPSKSSGYGMLRDCTTAILLPL
ncbi:hypothetical protein TNCV_3476281 [Trichonephila clavipes]|nr:hypothetical protein TNCV_3476281 [Trichonephila clavipes]